MTPPVIYYVKRIESFIREGVEPPAHLRDEVKCDYCGEKCWINRDNWRARQRSTENRITCDVCFRDGRHRTG